MPACVALASLPRLGKGMILMRPPVGRARCTRSRSRVKARCSRVPALDSLIPKCPRKLRIGQLAVKLQKHNLSLAQRQRRECVAHRPLPLDALELPELSFVIGRWALVQLALRLALAPAQLVDGGVAGDREEPGSRRPPGMLEPRARSIEPLERHRRHILRRRSVAEQ